MAFAKKSTKNILLYFSPLLVFYSIIVVSFSSDELVADEGRHMEYAINLTQGFYADTEDPSLRNGPGYPLVLAPFAMVNAPYLIIKLLNPIFLFLAVVFFFKTSSNYVSEKTAFILAYILGLYPVFIKWSIYIHSESFAIFLICGFLYYFIKLHNQDTQKNKHLIIAASFLGKLALTKVIFGYVILATFFFYVVVFLFKRSKKTKHSLAILAIAFMFCVPYLCYTYSVTGKTFYWGSQSGEILYWRSTPFPQEHGDWISTSVILENEDRDYINAEQIRKNHYAFISSLQSYSHVERDLKFKEKAVENIKEHPVKYIENTIASALRLFFNYPYSYTPQKVSTYFYILPNMFLVCFLSIAVFLALRNLRSLSFEVVFLSMMSLIFIGGLTLSDGRVRHLSPIIPVLLFFIIYVCKHIVLNKYISLNFRK